MNKSQIKNILIVLLSLSTIHFGLKLFKINTERLLYHNTTKNQRNVIDKTMSVSGTQNTSRDILSGYWVSNDHIYKIIDNNGILFVEVWNNQLAEMIANSSTNTLLRRANGKGITDYNTTTISYYYEDNFKGDSIILRKSTKTEIIIDDHDVNTLSGKRIVQTENNDIFPEYNISTKKFDLNKTHILKTNTYDFFAIKKMPKEIEKWISNKDIQSDNNI